MTENEILEVVFSIILGLMILIYAFGASESDWVYDKLDRWLKKRRKKREQRKAAAAARQ